MTSTQMMMTREELLEYAALDAFGLLDEYDADRYNRSFHDAAAAVQDEIRRLQAELTIDPTLIAVDEEPPFALRERVLAAVAAAIEREEAQLAPLATIGRGRHNESGYEFDRARYASAGMFWRAATFVLAAGALVMAYFWSGAVGKNEDLIGYIIHERSEEQVAKYLGDDYTDFVKHANGAPLVLRPVAGDFPGTATLYVKSASESKSGTAFLLATALPTLPNNGRYSLRAKIGETWETIRTFASNGVIDGLRLENLTAAALASTSWEIVDASGKTVLTA